MTDNIEEITEKVKAASGFIPAIISEMEKVIVGQKHLIERLILGLLTGEHILVDGVPCLAKTKAVKNRDQNIKAKEKRMP